MRVEGQGATLASEVKSIDQAIKFTTSLTVTIDMLIDCPNILYPSLENPLLIHFNLNL